MKRWEQIKRRPRRRAPSGDRSAFTLIELLVTISIIATLGAISITTARSAIETARRSQTETTIAKIDSVVATIYERYQYLRVEAAETTEYGAPSAAKRAWSRVERIRDLLRCDMPCHPDELTYGWVGAGDEFTPLQGSYLAAISGAYRGAADPLAAWSGGEGEDLRIRNAELLYLVVTNGDPESRSSFSDREIADTDGNGLLEFVDGWGRPICWMRWAPGLESSDRQPPIPARDEDGKRFVYDDELRDADPFNPLGVSRNAMEEGAPPTDNCPDKGWFLAPYVFSGGAEVDSEEHTKEVWYGLRAPKDCANDPYTDAFEEPPFAAGAPDGSKTHKDNIDNHTLAR